MFKGFTDNVMYAYPISKWIEFSLHILKICFHIT